MNETSTSDLGFVFNELFKVISIIYSDNEKTLITTKLVVGLSKIELKNIIQSMDDLNEPIPITYLVRENLAWLSSLWRIEYHYVIEMAPLLNY